MSLEERGIEAAAGKIDFREAKALRLPLQSYANIFAPLFRRQNG